uniref:DUF2690 domain-containing protein n=1 Tax=Streptomyces sp. TRM64462 TaxID=2741726 RepID=UPI001585E319
GPAVPRRPAQGRAAAAPAPGKGGHAVLMFLAGAVGALLVVAAAVLLADLGGERGGAAGKGGAPGSRTPSPSAPPTSTAPPQLPPGVRCFGADCAGEDPEAMGCGGGNATTAASASVGAARVEVRYSEVCGAAWARVVGGVPGERVEVSAGGTTREGTVRTRDDAYSPMVAVSAPADAKACATRRDGTHGCTTPD